MNDVRFVLEQFIDTFDDNLFLSMILSHTGMSLSLGIIACSFCCILSLNYKHTKSRRDYQLFLNSSYPELAC